MATIYVSHGDKGCIGKSYLSSVITDYILLRRRLPVLAVDGDMSIDGSVSNADFIARFANHPDVYTQSVSLNDPRSGIDAIYKLMDKIADSLGDGAQTVPDIVINTPANFAHTFTADVQRLIATMAEDYGMGIRVIYSIGQTALAIAGAESFIRTAEINPDDIIIALPTKDVSRDSWLNDKGIKSLVEQDLAFFVPRMSDELTAIYDSNPDKSLGTFFGDKGVKDLPLRDKLKYRMIEAHLREVFPVLEKYVIR